MSSLSITKLNSCVSDINSSIFGLDLTWFGNKKLEESKAKEIKKAFFLNIYFLNLNTSYQYLNFESKK